MLCAFTVYVGANVGFTFFAVSFRLTVRQAKMLNQSSCLFCEMHDRCFVLLFGSVQSCQHSLRRRD